MRIQKSRRCPNEVETAAVQLLDAVAGEVMDIAAHQHQPWPLLQRIENLTAKRMPLHQRDGDGLRPRISTCQADIRAAALHAHVDSRKIAEAPGKALINGDGRVPLHFDDLAEGCEDIAGESLGLELPHDGPR